MFCSLSVPRRQTVSSVPQPQGVYAMGQSSRGSRTHFPALESPERSLKGRVERQNWGALSQTGAAHGGGAREGRTSGNSNYVLYLVSLDMRAGTPSDKVWLVHIWPSLDVCWGSVFSTPENTTLVNAQVPSIKGCRICIEPRTSFRILYINSK